MRSISSWTLLAGAVLGLATTVPAAADFKVQQPDAETGEIAIEPLGDIGHDPLAAHSGEASFTEEFEYGVNGFWRTELELEQERSAGPGQSVNFSQVTSENIFQFTERGEYWADAGFFAEFGKTTLADSPDETTFGPIFRKEIFGTIDTVNLFIEKDIGNNASARPAFLYAWETRIALGTPIEPGFQAYGQPSGFAGYNSGLAAGQPHRPAIIRHHRPARRRQLEMERRHSVRRNPGRTARNPSLAGRVRDPFLRLGRYAADAAIRRAAPRAWRTTRNPITIRLPRLNSAPAAKAGA